MKTCTSSQIRVKLYLAVQLLTDRVISLATSDIIFWTPSSQSVYSSQHNHSSHTNRCLIYPRMNSHQIRPSKSLNVLPSTRPAESWHLVEGVGKSPIIWSTQGNRRDKGGTVRLFVHAKTETRPVTTMDSYDYLAPGGEGADKSRFVWTTQENRRKIGRTAIRHFAYARTDTRSVTTMKTRDPLTPNVEGTDKSPILRGTQEHRCDKGQTAIGNFVHTRTDARSVTTLHLHDPQTSSVEGLGKSPILYPLDHTRDHRIKTVTQSARSSVREQIRGQ